MAWSETFTETRLSKNFHLLGLMVKVTQWENIKNNWVTFTISPERWKFFTGTRFGKSFTSSYFYFFEKSKSFTYSGLGKNFHLVGYQVKIFTQSWTSKTFTFSRKSKNSLKWDFYRKASR